MGWFLGDILFPLGRRSDIRGTTASPPLSVTVGCTPWTHTERPRRSAFKHTGHLFKSRLLARIPQREMISVPVGRIRIPFRVGKFSLCTCFRIDGNDRKRAQVGSHLKRRPSRHQNKVSARGIIMVRGRAFNPSGMM